MKRMWKYRPRRLLWLCAAAAAVFFFGAPARGGEESLPAGAAVESVSAEVPALSQEGVRLVPSGGVFGVKFFTKGVIVIGTSAIEGEDGFVDPAVEAGLMKKDILLAVDGGEVDTVEALADAVERSGGRPLEVTYLRDGSERVCTVMPVKEKSSGRYKTGIWVRDSTAGIGTVTYYDPETGLFAGLGHGICDPDTAELMPMKSAVVVDVAVDDVVKGKPGEPGEVKGRFENRAAGSLSLNTVYGVYGTLAAPPKTVCEPMAIASKEEVHDGDAVVYCDPDGSGVKGYAVRLYKIDRTSDGVKSFCVEVTDEALIALTGGIVQGMSGSPIVQDGKLAGALTHVLVGDPTKGYGIFLETMLDHASEKEKESEGALLRVS